MTAPDTPISRARGNELGEGAPTRREAADVDRVPVCTIDDLGTGGARRILSIEVRRLAPCRHRIVVVNPDRRDGERAPRERLGPGRRRDEARARPDLPIDPIDPGGRRGQCRRSVTETETNA